MPRWCCNAIFLGWLMPLPVSADAVAMTHVLHSTPQLEQFPFCNGGTCTDVKTVGLNEEDWQPVINVFADAEASPEGERQAIAQAIGVLESIVGLKTGTEQDKGGTYGNSRFPGQLDCNDEAANSTTYLRLMARDGLLRFHTIEDTAVRGRFLFIGRHSTAVITDQTDGRRYAVDSWFYDNGHPAVVVPIDEWRSGWRPTDSKAH